MSVPSSKGYVEETGGHRKDNYCSLRVQKERERLRETEREKVHALKHTHRHKSTSRRAARGVHIMYNLPYSH